MMRFYGCFVKRRFSYHSRRWEGYPFDGAGNEFLLGVCFAWVAASRPLFVCVGRFVAFRLELKVSPPAPGERSPFEERLYRSVSKVNGWWISKCAKVQFSIEFCTKFSRTKWSLLFCEQIICSLHSLVSNFLWFWFYCFRRYTWLNS